MITAQSLTRRFGAHVAIDALTFHLERGEVVGFLGPNGAGKSTTMRILAGYLPATSGSALVAGFDVLRQSLEVRRRIGYLPESVPLYAEHRVEEMLWFQARLHRMTRKDAQRRIPEVLERAGIRDRSRAIIGGLSRGQRQRVGIAVALVANPEVLILDEPTSGLDPIQRIEMRRLLIELGHDHTVLLSSHILPEIDAVCPRVIILNRGRIAADGRKDELVAQLGGESRVRVEAVVGADVQSAVRLMKSLRGASEVRDLGSMGIHRAFEVLCREDLREDVGALAAARGWALRELSWQQPNLEQLFARIALDLPAAAAASSVPQGTAAAEAHAPTPLALATQPSAAPSRTLYNLNPFDQGASRDLSKPKRVDEAPPPGEGHA